MSFLADFESYLRSRTDAPPDFHVHAGMVALSVGLGNRVWCQGWTRPLYPNIWVVLIAPSGYGKSAPPDMCVSLLRKAQLEEHVLPGSFSFEALIDALSRQPVGVFEIQEFAAFTGTLNRDYNAGATQFLTELFDSPTEVRRLLRSGEVKIQQPCVSILGASSPDWFSEAFKAKDLKGGFYARFLFCPAFESGAYVGIPPARDEAIEAGLADHLRQVALLRGPADIDAVRPFLRAWDEKARLRARAECPPEFQGMRSRSGLYVLKTAMLFHISRDPRSLRISQADCQQAIDYVEHTHKLAEKFLTEEVAANPDEADRIKIVDNLKRANGRQDWSSALRQSRLSAFKFKNAVETLRQANRLWISKGVGPQGRAAEYLIHGAQPSVARVHGEVS